MVCLVKCRHETPLRGQNVIVQFIYLKKCHPKFKYTFIIILFVEKKAQQH